MNNNHKRVKFQRLELIQIECYTVSAMEDIFQNIWGFCSLGTVEEEGVAAWKYNFVTLRNRTLFCRYIEKSDQEGTDRMILHQVV